MDVDAIRRLADFDTPTVANGLELLAVQDPSVGFTGPDTRSLMPELGARVGFAVTARLDTTSPGTDEPHDRFAEWLRLIQVVAKGAADGPGSAFAVIEAVGPRPRYTVTIGDEMGTLLKLAGAVGLLTNGCIRDFEGVRNVPLACWAAGLAPMHGRLRWLDLNCAVVIDGVTVRPGDVIHADVNGAIVIPPHVAEQVYAKAQSVREREQRMFARMRESGMTLEAYLAREYG